MFRYHQIIFRRTKHIIVLRLIKEEKLFDKATTQSLDVDLETCILVNKY